ncbi:MAG: sensor histidine kinase [Bacteriovorax sp.]|nr:sensor histidine kinase [Bacteriovorax sp.]
MTAIQLMLLFFSLYLTPYSKVLASTIITSEPIEQDISKDFFIGQGTDQKNEKASLRFGYFNGKKWARVTLANNSPNQIDKLLYFDTLTGKIDLYEQVAPKIRLNFIGSSGSSIPFRKREFKAIFATFKISLPAHSEKTFFLNVVSRHNFNSKVFIGNLETMSSRQLDKLSFLDFYAGGILCLIFYNFFIFLLLKDKNYLYYCFFSLAFMLAILDIHGLLDKFFITKSFSFSHYLICFSALSLIFAVLFTYHFLEIPKLLNKLSKYFQIVFAICLGIFLIGLTPLEDLAPAFFGRLIDFLLITTNLSFIICAFLLIKISSTARFYLFSWAIVGISLLTWFAMTFGFLPNNFFTQHSLLFANLGQMLAISLALASRIHKVTEEKLAAEERALQKEKYHRLVRVLSHDIANSLTVINYYSNKLIKPRDLEPHHQRALEKVYFAGENIKNILKNVREEELLVERKKRMELHPINIYEILLNASVIFEDQLRHKMLELIIDVPVNIEIMANKTCFLNNIVNNIISNSIKFSYENSRIEISSEVTSDKIAITFKDYGRGIDPLQIHDIFYSNLIISTEGTRAEAGHGFGTILMREYVELFGGSIKVKSSLKDLDHEISGTSVTLIFPMSV